MKSFKWSRELILYLIELYEQHENLYNAANPDYFIRTKRKCSKEELLMQLKKVNSNIEMENIRAKLKNLRTQFVKEQTQVETSKKNGNEVYKPKLWCYDQIKFLAPHCNIRVKDLSLCNFDENSIDCDEIEKSANRNTRIYTAPTRKKEKDESLCSLDENSMCCDVVDGSANRNTHIYLPPKRKKENDETVCTFEENSIDCDEVDRSANQKTPIFIAPRRKIEHDETLCRFDENPIDCDEVDRSANRKTCTYPAPKKKKENIELGLQRQIVDVKKILENRIGAKYEWLGKQVVFEINKISDEEIQEETAWAIQSILRKKILKDRFSRQQKKRQSQSQGPQLMSSPSSSSEFQSQPSSMPQEEPLTKQSKAANRTRDPLEPSLQSVFDENDLSS